jgi:hypothetical protein
LAEDRLAPSTGKRESSEQEVFLDWRDCFLENCKDDRTAGRAWRRIESAGLDRPALWLLWHYAAMDKVFPQVQACTRLITRNVKVVERARQVAAKRRSDARSSLFERRKQDAVGDAARTPWFTHSIFGIDTLGEAASRLCIVGGLPVEEAPHVFAGAGEALRRYGPKMVLAVLDAGLQSRDLGIGSSSLAALARCARPDYDLDERTLRKFLQEDAIKAARGLYRLMFGEVVRLVELPAR